MTPADATPVSSLSAKAVALAQDVLKLHEEYEKQIAESRQKLEDQISQVDNLSSLNRRLESELADWKRGLRSEAHRPGDRDQSERNSQLEKEVAQLKLQLGKEASRQESKEQIDRTEQLEKEVTHLKEQLEKEARDSGSLWIRNSELEKEIAQLKRAEAVPGAEHKSPDEGVLTFNTESIFLQEKGQFIEFVLGVANNGKESKEYKQMYHFLLKCFTDADNNFDGRVGYLEFETLIDAAAFLPRRFGYAPSTPELYSTDFDRVKQRLQLFNGLKPKKAPAPNKQSGTYDYISFHTWLKYAIAHIKDKSRHLTNASAHSKLLGTKDEFQEFMLGAARSRRSMEYKELYHYVLKRFVDVDTDMDGMIDLDDFLKLLEKSPGKAFGFALDGGSEYANDEERRKACEKLFKGLDTDDSGYIGFDTWLEFFYTQFCKEAATLGCAGTVPDVEAGGSALAEPKCPWRV